MTDDPAREQAIQDHVDAGMLVRAPFTDEQVLALNRWQTSGMMHPFTCPSELHETTIRFTQESLDALRETFDAAVAAGALQYDTSVFDQAGEPRPAHILLIATRDGWRCACQECSYTQDWAHEFMARAEVIDGMERQWAELAGGAG